MKVYYFNQTRKISNNDSDNCRERGREKALALGISLCVVFSDVEIINTSNQRDYNSCWLQ